MEYIIGIDSGGTKTLISVYDIDMNFITNIKLGAGNIHQVKKEGFKELIFQIKENLEMYLPTTKFITFGIPGYKEGKYYDEQIEATIEKFFGEANYEIFNDIEIASFGALGFQNGINIISGTGSIAQLSYNGITKRIGGWGYLFGDEGSAYYIGKNILQLYTKQVDGRAEKSILLEIINREYDIKDELGIIDIIYSENNPRTIIASFCMLGAQALNEGCKESCKIFDQASYELAEQIITLSKNIDEELLVSYSGGVFNFEYVYEKVKEYVSVKNNLKFIRPLNEPVYGAVLYANKKSKK